MCGLHQADTLLTQAVPFTLTRRRTVIRVAHESKGVVEVREPLPLARVDAVSVQKQTYVWKESLLEALVLRVEQRLDTSLKVWDESTILTGKMFFPPCLCI